MLTEAERSAILADQIDRFAWQGWRILSQTATTATLSRPKRFSLWEALFWLLLCGVGILVYLFAFMARKDPVVRLVVTPEGKVQADWNGGDDDWPKLPGDWQCPSCAYPNGRQHMTCRRCGHHR